MTSIDITRLPVPIEVLYAGLGGLVLALIVATIQNKWSLRVFFILALRLAIGWHFLFEGMHKVHSHYVGPSETTRPFSSEPYFKEADGPLGPLMRKQLGDQDEQLKAKLAPVNVPERLAALPPNARLAFGPGSMTDDEFVKMVPPAVAADWKRFVDEFADKYKLDEAERKRIDGQLDEAERAEVDAARQLADLPAIPANKAAREELAKKAGPGDLSVASLAEYARWAVGVEPRESKVKYVSGDTPLTAPQRLEYIEVRKGDIDALLKRANVDLGTGYGLEMAKVKDAKGVVSLARATLLADADAFLTELKKGVFAAILTPKLAKLAPNPGQVIGTNDEKLASVMPAGAAPEAVTFAALPTGVRGFWDGYFAVFKANYPIPADSTAAVDEAFALSGARLANWYYDRDEYSGKPKPGFSALVKAAGDKAKVAEAAKAANDSATGGLEKALTTLAARKTASDAKAARDSLPAALDARFADLKKSLADAVPKEVIEGPVATTPDRKVIEALDWRTRWMLTAVGACLLLGLFTRLACIVGATFLVLTYLTHPPFPWLPLPPGTEGNPVFVNKNAIEFLGLMVVLVHPTGRWMGADALIHKLLFRNAPDPK